MALRQNRPDLVQSDRSLRLSGGASDDWTAAPAAAALMHAALAVQADRALMLTD